MGARISLLLLLCLMSQFSLALTAEEYERLPVYSRVLYSLMHTLAPSDGVFSTRVPVGKFDVAGYHSQRTMGDKPSTWFLAVTTSPKVGLIVATDRSAGEALAALEGGSLGNCRAMSHEARSDYLIGLSQMGPMEMHAALLRKDALEKRQPVPEVAEELFAAIDAHKAFVRAAGATTSYFVCRV